MESLNIVNVFQLTMYMYLMIFHDLDIRTVIVSMKAVSKTVLKVM